MRGPWVDFNSISDTGRFQPGDKGFGLLNRNSFISRPMEEQNGRLDLLGMITLRNEP